MRDNNRFGPCLFLQACLRMRAVFCKQLIRNGFLIEGQIWANQAGCFPVEEILTGKSDHARTGKSDHGRDHDGRLTGKVIAATDLTQGRSDPRRPRVAWYLGGSIAAHVAMAPTTNPSFKDATRDAYLERIALPSAIIGPPGPLHVLLGRQGL
jgi:hypothetical protein